MEATSCLGCGETGLTSCSCVLEIIRPSQSRRSPIGPHSRPRGQLPNPLIRFASHRRGLIVTNPLEVQPRVVQDRRPEGASLEASANREESSAVLSPSSQAPLPANVNGGERRGGELQSILVRLLNVCYGQSDIDFGDLAEVLEQFILDSRSQTAALHDRMGHVATSQPTKAQLKNDCSICLTDFQSTSVVSKLPCQHVFHQDCLTPWLEKSSSCPVCRESVIR
jgi:hypothetical protein